MSAQRPHPVLIFQYAPHEGPGYFTEFLQRRGVPHRIVRIDAGDPIPGDLAGVAGLVFMGGPMSVNDPLPWIPRAQQLIRQAVSADVPVLGHCLGGQLMASALGAPVTRNPDREIGWFPVSVVESEVARAWVGDLPDHFTVYHWHGETFEIPPGATRVLASRACPNQAFALGVHLGLQCHVEMTPEMIAEWIAVSGPELKPMRSVQDGPEMLRDVTHRVKELHRIADQLYERWLAGLVVG